MWKEGERSQCMAWLSGEAQNCLEQGLAPCAGALFHCLLLSPL